MTYFEEVAKTIIKKCCSDEPVSKRDLEKVIFELLCQIEYASQHNGNVFMP